MNRYYDLQKKIQEEVNAFPFGFAFTDKQFEEMMNKWGLKAKDTGKILSIGGGGFIQKKDRDEMHKMFEKHHKWMEEAIAADETGDGFIYDMFLYELENHEYCITYDVTDTLNCLGITPAQIENDARLSHGLASAMKAITG